MPLLSKTYLIGIFPSQINESNIAMIEKASLLLEMHTFYSIQQINLALNCVSSLVASNATFLRLTEIPLIISTKSKFSFQIFAGYSLFFNLTLAALSMHSYLSQIESFALKKSRPSTIFHFII